jgi:two-component system, LytTR family, response regulator
VLSEHAAAPAPDAPVEANSFQRIMVKQQGRSHFVRAEEVDWIESDGNYLRLHVGTRSHLVRGTIMNWAERLDQKRFVRIHRRFIVNMNRIQEIQPWFAGDCIVLLADGTKLRLSRTFREAFESRMLSG